MRSKSRGGGGVIIAVSLPFVAAAATLTSQEALIGAAASPDWPQQEPQMVLSALPQVTEISNSAEFAWDA